MGVYFYTLGPTITGEDSGELVTAAYHLGIAHPPGYPIWCLLGKLFTCVPHGTIAWRVNFMSAFFGAATVFLVTLLVIKLTRNRLAGVAAALALAFSGEFWEQSVIAEVYSLNAFFVAACVFFLVLWYQRRNDLILVAFAAVYGLSLCNHNTMHFLPPVRGIRVGGRPRPVPAVEGIPGAVGTRLGSGRSGAHLPAHSVHGRPARRLGQPADLGELLGARPAQAVQVRRHPPHAGAAGQPGAHVLPALQPRIHPLAGVVAAGGALSPVETRQIRLRTRRAAAAANKHRLVVVSLDMDKQSLWLNNAGFPPT